VFYSCASGASRNDEDPLVIDTSYAKNVHGFDVLGRNPTDRGRKASKISLLTNSRGTPLCDVLHGANKSDVLTLKHTLETFQRKVIHGGKYTELLACKGYDASHCRSVCQQHGLIASIASIPRRRTQDVYGGRYVVEQTFGLLVQFRRIRVRYTFWLSPLL